MYHLDEIFSEFDDEDLDGASANLFKADLEAEPNMEVRRGDILTVLPLRNTVLFPGVLLTVNVSRPRSKRQVLSAFNNDKLLAVVCQKERDTQEPSAEDLYNLGVSARIVRAIDMPDQSITIIVEGRERIEVEEFTTTKQNIIKAKVKVLPEVYPRPRNKEYMAVVSNVKDQALKIVQNADNMAPEANLMLRSIVDSPILVNYVIVNFGIAVADKQKLLAIDELMQRALKLLEILNTKS